MEDVQMQPARIPMNIDRVGIQNLSIPLIVKDRILGNQHTVAQVSLGVELPAAFKGTHMSRFVEVLEDWGEELNFQSMKRLLENVKSRLQAQKATISFTFPYFIRKKAPATQAVGLMSYQCKLTGVLAETSADEVMKTANEGSVELRSHDNSEPKPEFTLEVEVPVMSVCPCSKAISNEGAHSQRCLVQIAVRMRGIIWIEELVEIGEAAGSSPVYSLLKRKDEKYVTENAFANPAFVEDVVREAAARLATHEQVSWYKVQVTSMESIHNHEAFACIEAHK